LELIQIKSPAIYRFALPNRLDNFQFGTDHWRILKLN